MLCLDHDLNKISNINLCKRIETTNQRPWEVELLLKAVQMIDFSKTKDDFDFEAPDFSGKFLVPLFYLQIFSYA